MSFGAKVVMVGLTTHLVLSLLTVVNSGVSFDPALNLAILVLIGLSGLLAFGIIRRSRMAYAMGLLLSASQVFYWTQLARSEFSSVLMSPIGSGLVLFGIVISWRDAWGTPA